MYVYMYVCILYTRCLVGAGGGEMADGSQYIIDAAMPQLAQIWGWFTINNGHLSANINAIKYRENSNKTYLQEGE